jgi:tryptophan halogenase
MPQGYDAMADVRAGSVDAAGHLRNLREMMRAAAATFPAHDAVLAQIAGPVAA